MDNINFVNLIRQTWPGCSMRMQKDIYDRIEFVGVVPNPKEGSVDDITSSIWSLGRMVYSGDESSLMFVRNDTGEIREGLIWSSRASYEYDGTNPSPLYSNVARTVAADSIDIYGFNPSDPRQYQTEMFGAYETDEAKLYPSETFTLSSEPGTPELIWTGATFDTELVTNGDMELDSNWPDYGFEGGETNERSSTQAHAGTYSRHLIIDGANEGCYQGTIDYTSGEIYKVSGWSYVVSGTFRPRAYNGTMIYLTKASVSTTGEWIYWEEYFRSANTTTSGHLQLVCSSTGAEFYCDDVSIMRTLTWNYPTIGS